MDRWKCRSCGWSNPVTERACGKCRTTAPFGATRVIRKEEKDEAPLPQVRFPWIVPEVRFMAQKTWTAGTLVAFAEGWYLVSEKDGAVDETTVGKIKIPKDKEAPISAGKGSIWIPGLSIKKLVKSTTPGYVIDAGGEKIPVRFDSAVRPRFLALCAFMGIEA